MMYYMKKNMFYESLGA